jgi:hypothetical protein
MAMRLSITLSMKPELVQRLDNLADAQSLSRSQLVEQFIMRQLEQEEQNVKVLANPAVMRAMMQAFSDPAVLKGFAAAVGEQLEPQQLELFHRSLTNINAAASDAMKRWEKRKQKNTRKKRGRG